MARIFEAKFNGRCGADCGWPIQEGERVTYVDDLVLVHADCSRDASLRKPVEVVCEKCWLTKPCECGSYGA